MIFMRASVAMSLTLVRDFVKLSTVKQLENPK